MANAYLIAKYSILRKVINFLLLARVRILLLYDNSAGSFGIDFFSLNLRLDSMKLGYILSIALMQRA